LVVEALVAVLVAIQQEKGSTSVARIRLIGKKRNQNN
jgi:hypothetical protein